MFTALGGFTGALALMVLRLPIFLALAVVGGLGFGLLVGWPQAGALVAMTTRDSVMSYGLVVIPLFILMGNTMAQTQIATELFRAAAAFAGHRRGGLAVATVGACAGFATVCGSSVASVYTIGRTALPQMREHGYDEGLSAVTVAAGATLGIIIPPSILLVIFGIITETHIGKLYAAALVPGLLGLVLYVLTIAWIVARRPQLAPVAPPQPWSERLAALRGVWPVATLLTIVLGGIYAGIFTVNEAAGMGAAGALAISAVRRQLDHTTLVSIFVATSRQSAVLFVMLIGAGLFVEFLNFTGVHKNLLAFVQGAGLSPTTVIVNIALVYIVLGALMEELSMILLTVPIFFPVVIGLGFDPVWFGVFVVVLCEVGLICPPVGMNLFVVQGLLERTTLPQLMRGIAPFVLATVLRVFLLVLFPALALFLPRLLF